MSLDDLIESVNNQKQESFIKKTTVDYLSLIDTTQNKGLSQGQSKFSYLPIIKFTTLIQTQELSFQFLILFNWEKQTPCQRLFNYLIVRLILLSYLFLMRIMRISMMIMRMVEKLTSIKTYIKGK